MASLYKIQNIHKFIVYSCWLLTMSLIGWSASSSTASLQAADQLLSDESQLASTGHITGTVTTFSNEPLSGIHILVYQVVNGNTVPMYSSPYFTPVTDGFGKYDVADLQAGTYRVEFSDLYGSSEPQYVSEFYDNAITLASAKDIIVGNNIIVANINAQLALRSRIFGRVTNEHSEGLTDIVVRAYRYNDHSSAQGQKWEFFNLAMTDLGGNYQVPGLIPGKYHIGYYDENGVDPRYAEEYYGDAADVEVGTDITITGVSEVITNIDEQLEPTGQISGVLKGQDGKPFVYPEIFVYRQSPPGYEEKWKLIANTTPKPDGSYLFAGLRPGNYRVEFLDDFGMGIYARQYYDNVFDIDSAQDVAVLSGLMTPNINAQLVLYGYITGAVTDGLGNAIENVEVGAYRYVTTSQESLWHLEVLGRTLADGSYSIGSLPAGRYKVFFSPSKNGLIQYADEYYYHVFTLEEAQEIVVAVGVSTPNINTQLLPANAYRLYPDSLTVNEGSEVTTVSGGATSLFANDINLDNDLLEVQLIAKPKHGLFALNADGTFQYTHDGSETTSDSFIYSVMDTHWTVTRTEEIHVLPVNDPPLTYGDHITLPRGTATNLLDDGTATVLANDRDPDTTILTATLVTTPQYGSLALNADGTFVYKHDGSSSPQDLFTYRADDGVNQSSVTTVTITVNPASSFIFSKTVGIAGIAPPCTAKGEMKVPVGTIVTYCYTVLNIGILPLVSHTLVDSHLGLILDNEHIHLMPGLSYSKILTQALSIATANVATWTATADSNEARANLTTIDPGIRSKTSATVMISSSTDDQDHDTIPDNLESASDPDHDNLPSFLDTDADGDDISDQVEVGSDAMHPKDSNNNEVPDFLEPDKPLANFGVFLPMVRR